MSKEELKPVDLGHLQSRAIELLEALNGSEDVDRSDKYREYQRKKAKDLAEVQVRNFRYIFDNYKIGGIVPYGLDEEPTHE